MDITKLIGNVAVLFVMMIPGIILKKGKMVSDTFGKGISNLVLYIAQPVLIVCAYLDCTLSFSDIWKNVVAVFVFSVIAHGIFAPCNIQAAHSGGSGQDRGRRILCGASPLHG